MTSLVDLPARILALRHAASYEHATKLDSTDSLKMLLARCSKSERTEINLRRKALTRLSSDGDVDNHVSCLKTGLQELLIKYELAKAYVIGIEYSNHANDERPPVVHVLLRPMSALCSARRSRRKTH